MKFLFDPARQAADGGKRFMALGIKLAMTGMGDGQSRHRRSFNGLINALAASAFLWVLILGLIIAF